MRRLTLTTAIAVVVLGIVVGVLFLFAPLGTGCSVTATTTAPGFIATPGPQVCRSYSLVQAQPVWPMPLLAIVVWSLAPSITAIGLIRRLRGRGSGTPWIIAGVVIECTVLISFGAAPFFVRFVLLPLLIVTAVAIRATRPSREGTPA
jgi:hypothetical protein